MDSELRKQELMERAERVEETAFRDNNVQANDVLRALALLYREMAEELDDDGLFERRLFSSFLRGPLDAHWGWARRS